MSCLIAYSGLLEQAIGRALRPVDAVGQSYEYLQALTLEKFVAQAVPEAPVHMDILPYVIRLLEQGASALDVNVEVRHACVEVLAQLSYTRHRSKDMASMLPSHVVTSMLELKGSENILLEAVQGKALLYEADPTPSTRASIKAVGGMDLTIQVDGLKSRRRTSHTSTGMREFYAIIDRSVQVSHRNAALSSKIDGHLFFVGLLLANLCEEILPGTDRRFGDVAVAFWERTMFFPGLGLCLTACIRNMPGPPLCDGSHTPLSIVLTCEKLIAGGFAKRMNDLVGALVEAILLRLSPTPLTQEQLRTSRLATVALRGLVANSKNSLGELQELVELKNGSYILEALHTLAEEEPTAAEVIERCQGPRGTKPRRVSSNDRPTSARHGSLRRGASLHGTDLSAFSDISEGADLDICCETGEASAMSEQYSSSGRKTTSPSPLPTPELR